MTIKGTFKNGVVIPEGDRKIPDGTSVEILVDEGRPLSAEVMKFAGCLKGRYPSDFARNHDRPVRETKDKAPQDESLSELLLRFAGTAKQGLPTDFARNHDHYIHGTPKLPERE